VSSTESPNALNTKIVDGFNGIPKYPIKPVIINGSKLESMKRSPF
jgi:hypothetical protein